MAMMRNAYIHEKKASKENMDRERKAFKKDVMSDVRKVVIISDKSSFCSISAWSCKDKQGNCTCSQFGSDSVWSCKDNQGNCKCSQFGSISDSNWSCKNKQGNCMCSQKCDSQNACNHLKYIHGH
ncbi:hypothetical protein PBY51_020435 [Eleginops maclovinus]|uniref:Uncharacterized protein n=1 Tax=Eleginops maclovinus TaxID=56733 RepID=A0AAN8AT80_ELEMC|nr:hypothetical protein PBY51_020435 [Eleginops maclovinus]